MAENILKTGFPAKNIKVNTNMVFLDLEREGQQKLQSYLKSCGIVTLSGYTDKLRLVLHKDITEQQALHAGQMIGTALLQGGLCSIGFNLSNISHTSG